MSRALSIADQMAVEARDLPKIAASGSTVSVYRQQDLASEINTAIKKAKGAAVVIVWDGYERPEENMELKGQAVRVVSRYSVQLFYAPVLKPGGTTVDEIAEELITHFDAWTPTRQAVSRDVWMRFRGATPDPDEESGLMVYDLTFEIVIQFSNPT